MDARATTFAGKLVNLLCSICLSFVLNMNPRLPTVDSMVFSFSSRLRAFQAETMQWYRFGQHTGHVFARDIGPSADDLLQGKVGDCWFLSGRCCKVVRILYDKCLSIFCVAHHGLSS